MTYQEVINALSRIRSIEVGYELTAGERKAVREGLAVQRVYQDQPADVAYPFRPKKYTLIRGDDFFVKTRSLCRQDAWESDRELPMLDALLSGKKLWNIEHAPAKRMERIREVRDMIKEEHAYMCDSEPPDRFHTCILLGALNLIDGLLGDE